MPGYSTIGDVYLRSAGEGEVSGYRRELDMRTGIVSVTYVSRGVRYGREAFASIPDRAIVVRLTADRPRSLSFTIGMHRPADFEVRAAGDRDLMLTQGPGYKEQIDFQSQVQALANGGTVRAAEKTLSVLDADDVTLLIAAATDFLGQPPARRCSEALYFQFARHLLTGSSRPGGLPANS